MADADLSGDVLQRARDQLVELVRADVPKLRRAGREYVALCPFHAERTPSFTLYRRAGGDWRFKCFGCGAAGDAIGYVRQRDGVGFREAVERIVGEAPARRAALTPAQQAAARRRAEAEERARLEATAWALQLWRKGRPAGGTLVETYLRARGVTLPPPPALRFLPRAHYREKGEPTGRWYPVMLAAVRAPDGRFLAVHRTYLAPDGRAKAPEDMPKQSLGPVLGGAVQLTPAGDSLAVAEAIENGLSLLQACDGLPVWAAVSAATLAGVELPDTVRSIVVCPDADRTGLAAARRCAARHAAAGRAVRVAPPPGEGGADFNDLLRT